MNNASYTIQEVAEIIQAELFMGNAEERVEMLVTDSRRINDPNFALFFAIQGQKDGHLYLEDAYKRQLRNFVVSKKPASHLFPEANFLVVQDPLQALQQLTARHRTLFNYPVIGITGSNGKTIVKEWLYQLLNPDFYIVKNPRSYNSQIGVPISVWQMTAKHQLAIFEAGISKVGEMQNLEQIIRPTLGVLTNIGDAHNEGFESHSQKMHEKCQLFKNVELVVARQIDIDNFASADAKKVQFFTWGRTPECNLFIISEKNLGSETQLEGLFNQQKYTCKIPFVDQASIENAITCWATLLAMDMQPELVAQRLEKLQRVGMRLELKPGINRTSIIDDSYSADIPSLAIALDFLNQQNQHKQKTLILSDLVQTGKEPAVLYKEIADLLKQKQIHRLIGIGEQISQFQALFQENATFFKDTNHFLSAFASLQFSEESILIKGARKFEFERISKVLTFKSHDTVLEINLEAMTQNLNFYRSKLEDSVKLMVMVKAFSYGSGTFEIANLLQFNKVDYLAVAYADEGVALVNAGIKLPIMVMSPSPSAFEAIIEHQLQPELYSVEVLKAFINYLPETVVHYPIHIKLDTGMHRLGFCAEEDTYLLELLQSTSKVKVMSIFTHLVGSSNEQLQQFTLEQIDQFRNRVSNLEFNLEYGVIKHVLNTSGIVNFPDAQMDMVRLGIGLYGYDAALNAKRLSTVATLKTTITQIKHLSRNDTVGYDRAGQMPNGGTIATVRIGYADGYSRAFGKGVGKMLVNGALVPTIGSICMDMCMLDVTGMDVRVGDEVVVFNEVLNIAQLAEQIETIPYEILTNVSQRVKRVYYYE